MSRGSNVIKIICTALLALVIHPSAWAQECGQDYIIKKGDSLASIASTVYGNPSSVDVIIYANQDRLTSSNSLVSPGNVIRIPCAKKASGVPAIANLEARPVDRSRSTIVSSHSVRRMELLTADEYKPFTGRSLENGGMLVEILNAAMEGLNAEVTTKVKYNVSWVNDWSAHLDPLLTSRAFDLGFPWFRPACKQFDELNKSSQFRCRRFFFSDPLFEVSVVFFVRNDSKFEFDNDKDVHGKLFCRPAGYSNFIFDENERNWLKENRIILLNPTSISECFRLLKEGAVDAVAINEFSGREALSSLGLTSSVRVLERPVSINQLYVVVTKTHPQARTLLYYVNAAIKRLRQSGQYDRIIERHLTAYWDSLDEAERALVKRSAEKTDAPTTPSSTASVGSTE